jgi:hypothetical protein
MLRCNMKRAQHVAARFSKKQAFRRVGLGGYGPGSSIADERPRSKQVAGDDYGKGEHW